MESKSSRSERKGAWASVAAVGAAVTASACCLGPAVLLALGVGGLGFASVLEPYRPYFLALTALFLAGAFYFAYRPQVSAACAADGSCTPHARRRMRLFVWGAALLALAAAAYPQFAGARARRMHQDGGSSSLATMESAASVELKITGMTCAACAGQVRKSLEAVPGVTQAIVRYPEGEATVQLAQDVSAEVLIAAVDGLGYGAAVTGSQQTHGTGSGAPGASTTITREGDQR